MKPYNTFLGGDEPFRFDVSPGERVVITRLSDNVVVFDRTYTSYASDSFIDADASGMWISRDYRVDVYSGGQTYTFYIHSIAYETVYTVRLLDSAGQVGSYYKRFVQYTAQDGKTYVVVDYWWTASSRVYVPPGWSVVIIYKVAGKVGEKPYAYGQVQLSNVNSNYDVTAAQITGDYVEVEREYRISAKLVRDVVGDAGMQILQWAVNAANPLLAFVGGGVANVLAKFGVYGVSYIEQVRIEGDYVYVKVKQTEDVYNNPLLMVLYILLGVLVLSYVAPMVTSIFESMARQKEAEMKYKVVELESKAVDYATQICGSNADCVNKMVSTILGNVAAGVQMASTTASPYTPSWFETVPWWGWLLAGLFIALLLRR